METKELFIRNMQRLFQQKFHSNIRVEEVEVKYYYLSIPEYLEMVCNYFSITPDDVKGRWSNYGIGKARYWFYYFAYKHGGYPPLSISAYVCKTTKGLYNSISKISNEMGIYEDVKKEYDDLCAIETLIVSHKKNGLSHYKDVNRTN